MKFKDKYMRKDDEIDLNDPNQPKKTVSDDYYMLGEMLQSLIDELGRVNNGR